MARKTYQTGCQQFEAKPVEHGLYIVATPMGNLSDITICALETLTACDLIVCEDTRTGHKLLHHFNIRTRMIAYHEHNAASVSEHIINAMNNGRTIALISNAGTPLIFDPGYCIVKAAIASGNKVIPIPGASSFLTAIMAAGLPTGRLFMRVFFLIKKPREDRLNELSFMNATLVFFDSPHRITASLKSGFTNDRSAA